MVNNDARELRIDRYELPEIDDIAKVEFKNNDYFV